MTDCARGDIRDRLPELVHDRLGASERAEVARHVAACAACTAEVALLRSMRAALERAPAVDVARIALAVRAAVTPVAAVPGAAHRAPVAAASTVTPLAARVGRRRGEGWRWRAAAAITVVAVGGAAYALGRHDRGADGAARGGSPRGASAVIAMRAEQAAPVSPAPTTTDRASPDALGGRPSAGRAATPAAREAIAAAGVPRGLSVDGGVSDLADGDVRALLQSLDHLDAAPDADPAPIIDLRGTDGAL